MWQFRPSWPDSSRAARHSSLPFYSVAFLCLLAGGVCSYFAPFWALPSEFLTGFSAAAGIALINSVGALGGFAGRS